MPLKSAEEYDIENDEWKFISEMPIRSRRNTWALLDSLIYICGEDLDNLITFNPETHCYMKFPMPPFLCHYPTIAAANGKLYWFLLESTHEISTTGHILRTLPGGLKYDWDQCFVDPEDGSMFLVDWIGQVFRFDPKSESPFSTLFEYEIKKDIQAHHPYGIYRP